MAGLVVYVNREYVQNALGDETAAQICLLKSRDGRVRKIDASAAGAAVAGEPGTDIGNVGRNCLRGPRQANVDFGVFKRFGIGESRNIEFRAEFFNFFNRVNLANPISDFNAIRPSGGDFDANGRVTSPGDFGHIVSTSNNPGWCNSC